MILPKLSVSNYPEMLRKLSSSAFLVTAFSVTYLRAKVPEIEALLSVLDASAVVFPKIGEITMPFGTLASSFLVAVVSESIRLHDKVSNLIGIRLKFDVEQILKPMAQEADVELNDAQQQKLVLDRNRLMGELFYAYASSSPGKAKIDPHNITQALTTWSWYWMAVEAIVILALVALSLIFFGKGSVAWLPAICIGVLLILMKVFYGDCCRYANTQVKEILADQTRLSTIVNRFNAL